MVEGDTESLDAERREREEEEEEKLHGREAVHIQMCGGWYCCSVRSRL